MHLSVLAAGMKAVWCALLLVVPAVAQKLAPFDAASASSVYSPASFGAELVTSESSGHGFCCLIVASSLLQLVVRYWCSAGLDAIFSCSECSSRGIELCTCSQEPFAG